MLGMTYVSLGAGFLQCVISFLPLALVLPNPELFGLGH